MRTEFDQVLVCFPGCVYSEFCNSTMPCGGVITQCGDSNNAVSCEGTPGQCSCVTVKICSPELELPGNTTAYIYYSKFAKGRFFMCDKIIVVHMTLTKINTRVRACFLNEISYHIRHSDPSVEFIFSFWGEKWVSHFPDIYKFENVFSLERGSIICGNSKIIHKAIQSDGEALSKLSSIYMAKNQSIPEPFTLEFQL